MGIERVEGWESILFTTIKGLSERKLDWDEYNCAHFTGEILNSFTNTDFLERVGIEELDEAFCLPLWEEAGLIPSVDSRIGIEHNSNMLQCGRGDLVCHDGKALGICVGEISAFMGVEKGVMYIPTHLCSCFWRI